MRFEKFRLNIAARVRGSWLTALAMVALVASAGAIGCGGGSSPSGPSTPPVTTPAGPANVAGSYTFTYTASGACAAALPASFRTRSYQAAITQTGSQIAVNLVGSFQAAVFGGAVSGNSVSFTWAFAENVSGGALIGPAFSGSGTASNAGISGTMSGTLQYSPSSGSNATCTAADHQFAFTPR